MKKPEIKMIRGWMDIQPWHPGQSLKGMVRNKTPQVNWERVVVLPEAEYRRQQATLKTALGDAEYWETKCGYLISEAKKNNEKKGGAK